MGREWELWKKRQFDDFYKKYVGYLESEEGRLDYLAQMYFLLHNQQIMDRFLALGIDNSTVH